MGLREEIQSGLAEAFDDPDGLADVITSFTLVKTVKGAYNRVTDSYDENEISYSSRGIFGSYSARELVADARIRSEDHKVLINGSDISVPIEVNDLIRTESEEMIVHDVKPVMGGESIPIVWRLRVGGNG